MPESNASPAKPSTGAANDANDANATNGGNAVSADDVLARYRRAMERRRPWTSHWRQCYEVALPQRTPDTTPGSKRHDRLFDGTAADGVDQLAASLVAHLTPPWTRWVGLQPGADVTAEERDQLASELETIATTCQSHFDRANFAIEMLLEAVDIREGRLEPDRLQVYGDGLDYAEMNGRAVLRIGQTELVSATCWWDPSYGRADRGDASVVACVFSSAKGEYYLHRVRYLSFDGGRLGEQHEAEQLCLQAADFVRDNHLPSVTVETNGVGRFLPGILRRTFAEVKLFASVLEVHSTKPKDQRILEAFDAPMAAGRIRVHDSVLKTPFMTEMREWRPGTASRKQKDDGLDAVAGCLLSEPVRLSALSARPPPRPDWRAGTSSVTAPNEFDV